MKLMIMINMTLNILFLIMKHPLSLGTTIIMQTTIISMMTGMMYKSFWFSYILFLMFIGGMMVLFIYMTSLMPNMMFKLPTKNLIIMTSLIIMMTTIINKKYNIMNNDMNMTEMNTTMLTKMFSAPTNNNTILLAMYLFFTMITVFTITESNNGPLRMKY
uniref:NADH-ubiquinone oxidoreductase chain 6 n=1 Tax=Orestes mouhotii TaxID=590986 RepID=E2RUU1_9NEOP|nr:NADH dehydrogenase subunit 6 [Orestes mouhotii]